MVLVAINFRSTHLRHETLPVCAPLRRPGWNVTLSGLFWGRALSAWHPGRLDALVSTQRPWGPPGGPAALPATLSSFFWCLRPWRAPSVLGCVRILIVQSPAGTAGREPWGPPGPGLSLPRAKLSRASGGSANWSNDSSWRSPCWLWPSALRPCDL